MDDIIIKDYSEIDLEELLQLYENAGWSNYVNNPQMLQKAYENSLKTLSAWKEDKLIGIIRVVGDGSSIIYIQDILVRKEYQRQGIGSRLLAEILQHYKDVYQKVLLTDNQPDTVAFYKKFGFIRCDDFGCIAFGIVSNN